MTGNWNPVEVIQGQGTGLVLVILLVMVVLAQWSTNMAANAIPAALAFVNAAAPRTQLPVGGRARRGGRDGGRAVGSAGEPVRFLELLRWVYRGYRRHHGL